jgi:chromosome segregation ATPase
MKKIKFLVLALAIYQFSFAQAYDGQIEYNKKAQAAVIAEFKYPEETIEKTLKDRIDRLGLKLKSSKGFLVAYNAVITSINSNAADYAFKIERKSKREKDVMLVSLVMNVGELNTIADNAANAKSFLNDLMPAIDALNTDNMINEQYEALTKAQKKYKNLQEDQQSLEKKIRNLQDDLSKNSREQQDQQNEVKRQQEILDAIKAKKK